jgi:integrase
VALVRALVVTWLFAGLRWDELRRLRVGCIRWQRGDVTVVSRSEPPAVLPKAAAERLGHSSIVLFNDTYAHILQEIDADAAAKLGAVIKGRRRPTSAAH